MRIVFRSFLFLVFITIAVSTIAFWQYREYTQHNAQTIHFYKLEKDIHHDSIRDLLEQSLSSFVYDYSWWDGMVRFVQSPDLKWWESEVEGVPEIFQTELVWVLDSEFKLVHSINTRNSDETSPVIAPLRKDELTELFRREAFPVFFAKYNNNLIQIAAAPIQPGDDLDRTSKPKGYLLVGRYWSEEYFDKISKLLQAKVTLISLQRAMGVQELLSPENNTKSPQSLKMLMGWDNKPIASYLVSLSDNFGANMRTYTEKQIKISLFSVFGLLILIAYVLYCWLIHPLNKIQSALTHKNSNIVSKLSEEPSEWGEVSSLIKDFFIQEKSLKTEVNERKIAEEVLKENETKLKAATQKQEQIAKDLHDDIIQSIYAVGLHIAQIQGKIDYDKEASAQGLNEIQESLNDVIRNVRNFIAGLAPEALQEKDIASALTQLVEKLQRISTATISLTLSDQACNQLTNLQRLHIFHIVHELMSNAIRHAQANNIACSISSTSKEILLTVKDDGKGFSGRTAQSSGLKNIELRTQFIQAQCNISPTQEGTEITISIPYQPVSSE